MPEIAIRYQPRRHFFPFHNREQRFACMVAHRRAGKTVACVNEAVTRALYSKRHRPRYAYIGPLLKQAKKIAWEYLKEYTAGMQGKKPSESELTVKLVHNNAEISIYGADNPDAFRGQYFDGVILDEYGDMAPSVWSKVLLPTLADRQGWAVFIGTPKGKNHFYKIFRRSQGLDLPENHHEYLTKMSWYNFILRASESGILPPDELMLQRSEMTEDEYLQEYECSFDAAVLGTYYASLINLIETRGQVSEAVEYDPNFPVYVVFDLGYSDSTAAWFYQTRPDGLAIIDYEEASGKALSYYFDTLRHKGYRYGKIWLPHDARAKSLQTGRSTVEQFLAQAFPTFDEGQTRLVDIVPNLSLQHGIDAARLIIPSCHFNVAKTHIGLECLRAYRRRWDEELRVFSDTPLHDWSSHGADAFRYLALVAKERIVLPKSVSQIDLNAPVQYTLDDLWEMNKSSSRSRMRI
jgi:phage terminase large subunit